MSTRTQEIHAMLQAHLDELVNQSQRIEDEIRLVQASLHALMGQAVVFTEADGSKPSGDTEEKSTVKKTIVTRASGKKCAKPKMARA